jgi:hypothetical protein
VTWAPGARPDLPLKLDLLPAMLRVAANAKNAVVTVDGLDVGLAPLELSRPPGRYRVALRGPGLLPYRAEVALAAGQDFTLRAVLEPQRTSIVKKWWFWTSIGAALTGVALAAYFGARASETPPLDGGGLQWVVDLR